MACKPSKIVWQSKSGVTLGLLLLILLNAQLNGITTPTPRARLAKQFVCFISFVLYALMIAGHSSMIKFLTPIAVCIVVDCKSI